MPTDAEKLAIRWPGRWIGGPDRDWAFETQLLLSYAEDEFECTVVACSKFGLIAPGIFHPSSAPEPNDDRCLREIYARAFVYGLASITKLLTTLKEQLNPPPPARLAIDQFLTTFGQVKHIRDSIMHVEDRGRALDRQHRPLKTNVVVLGGLSSPDNCFETTGEDGARYRIEIKEQTLESVRVKLQAVIDGYEWE